MKVLIILSLFVLSNSAFALNINKGQGLSARKKSFAKKGRKASGKVGQLKRNMSKSKKGEMTFQCEDVSPPLGAGGCASDSGCNACFQCMPSGSLQTCPTSSDCWEEVCNLERCKGTAGALNVLLCPKRKKTEPKPKDDPTDPLPDGPDNPENPDKPDTGFRLDRNYLVYLVYLIRGPR